MGTTLRGTAPRYSHRGPPHIKGLPGDPFPTTSFSSCPSPRVRRPPPGNFVSPERKQRRQRGNRKTNHIEKATFHARDQGGTQPLDPVASRFIERFTGRRVCRDPGGIKRSKPNAGKTMGLRPPSVDLIHQRDPRNDLVHPPGKHCQHGACFLGMAGFPERPTV